MNWLNQGGEEDGKKEAKCLDPNGEIAQPQTLTPPCSCHMYLCPSFPVSSNPLVHNSLSILGLSFRCMYQYKENFLLRYPQPLIGCHPHATSSNNSVEPQRPHFPPSLRQTHLSAPTLPAEPPPPIAPTTRSMTYPGTGGEGRQGKLR